MKPKILITRKIADEVVSKISEVCEVDMWPDEERPIPREILEKKVEDIEGIFCLITETIDEKLLNNAPKLKVISNMAVGHNNIDINVAKERGITVTNTPGVLTETTADLTFALLMATSRRIIEASNFIRNGNWKAWAPMQLTGQDVFGTTIGIIGMGRIGEAVARRAKGFDMKVLYYNRNRKHDIEEMLGVHYTDMDTLLQQSDFVVIMAPYTPETNNLISHRELSLMKNSAILINTARGGIVDEDALYQALKNNGIWAAGLDVFATEPVPFDHPLLTLPNVVTLPHIGSASIRTRIKMAHLAADNLINGVTGKIPAHVVV
ncbi:2-hydroxyacid dehydrogenase [Calidifontibacillus oryziterrae]|uniref:2-hydroxyacid dehydrogenase n=1 Tax=Calidifontibacillus oryziterrae TaxID=1191699 RepID=UPI0002D8C9BA|nr:D-glycerate dehydrogenase [Calidifontibacillus oryziterrae]